MLLALASCIECACADFSGRVRGRWFLAHPLPDYRVDRMAIEATSIFGGGTAVSIFAANVTGGASEAQQAAQVVVDAAKQQINRIRGYKLQLTPADNKRLEEIQAEIVKINQKATNGTVRQDEIEDRAELFLEADIILGKPSAEVENDDVLDDIRARIDEVLAPRLTPQQEDRLATLNTLLANFEERLADDPSNVIAIRQVQNIQKQIANIDVPRLVTQLSVSEKLEYDALVEEANTHAGAKLLLNARETGRVQALEETIASMEAQLPPDPAGQPTAAAIARAYTRF